VVKYRGGASELAGPMRLPRTLMEQFAETVAQSSSRLRSRAVALLSCGSVVPQIGAPVPITGYRNYIGGRFVDTQRTFEDVNPATGEVRARAYEADSALVNEAVSAAQKALQDPWRNWTVLADVDVIGGHAGPADGVLDPATLVRSGGWTEDRHVVFVHTEGTPADRFRCPTPSPSACGVSLA
jgi:Aldehyde dehydrogenase family